MIGRGTHNEAQQAQHSESAGFDTFDLRLGDVMRGERATMGKSLLDVQRELKIKAAYIAAIENADASAFDTPGFIAGYVRSYARYLGMDPDQAFRSFCAESGFSSGLEADKAVSGVSVKPARPEPQRDTTPFGSGPYRPSADPVFAAVEPRAVGSVMVLLGLIAGLGFVGWSILQEVQRVQFAPVEQTPQVASNIDPLAGNTPRGGAVLALDDEAAPSAEAMDRLSRPEALDVPVMIARDGPISSLDPRRVGTLPANPDTVPSLASAPALIGPMPAGEPAVAVALSDDPAANVQVTADPAPAVQLVAVRPAWVRVRSAEGAVLYEGIMNAGDTYTVPQTEDPATLRVGESGAIYFALNGVHFGPAGNRGAVTSNLALSSENLMQSYQMADIDADTDLQSVVNVAQVEPAN